MRMRADFAMEVGPFQFETTWQGCRPSLMSIVIIILVSDWSRNGGTCSVVQVIWATFSKTHLWNGWSLVVWSQHSHWAHSTHQFWVGLEASRWVRAEKSHMTLMGFEPKTFWHTVKSANHYAMGAGIMLALHFGWWWWQNVHQKQSIQHVQCGSL